jgi:hypothetical protein
MRRLPGLARVVPRGAPLPPYDCHLPLASLPFVLDIEEALKSAAVPYLTVDPDRVAAVSRRLPKGNFRVGVAGQAKRKHGSPEGRPITLATVAPLGHVPGVQLINLDEPAGLGPSTPLPTGTPIASLGDDLAAGPDKLLDLAAVMMQLDLIVTGDSVIAHLAGGLGRPVWILLKDVPDWRWSLDRTDSPWYPTARLFRQSRRDDWDGVVAEAVGALGPIVAQKTGRSAEAAASSAPVAAESAATPYRSDSPRLLIQDVRKGAGDVPGVAKPAASRNPRGTRRTAHNLVAHVSGIAVAGVLVLTPFQTFQRKERQVPAGQLQSFAASPGADHASRPARSRRRPSAGAGNVGEFAAAPQPVAGKPVALALLSGPANVAATKASTTVASARPPPKIAANWSKLPHASVSPSHQTTVAPLAVASAAPLAATALKPALALGSKPLQMTAVRPQRPAAGRSVSRPAVKPPTMLDVPIAAARASGLRQKAVQSAAVAKSVTVPIAPVAREAEKSVLRARGDAMLATGDIASARLFYERAADAGDGESALHLGETYDPAFLARARLPGARPDAAAAARWYHRARELGVADAAILLKALAATPAAARAAP